MTTKVKIRKYRLRHGKNAAGGTASAPAPKAAKTSDKLFDNGAADDGFGSTPYPGSTAADHASQSNATPPVSDDETSVEAEIDAIRREGLTGRQLRMARRVAQKNSISASSDFDAIRQLRKRGIDPFDRSAVLALISTERSKNAHALTTTEDANLPQTVSETAQLPSKGVIPPTQRDFEISQIQRDIVRRRQRKLMLLAARLFVFIGLPTLIAGFYFYTVSTPMYATKSAFLIQQADSAATGATGLSGLLSGTGFATSQDSIAVQDYLNSRDAMLRLEQDASFKSVFSGAEIDPLQRLPENATNEDAYKLYRKKVSIGYDPTEGLLRMEVIAPNPKTSQEFSELLVKYAEEQVDHLTQRMRENQMKDAREVREDAEAKMSEAQERVVTLQEQLGVISADAETAAVMTQISGFETQLQQKRLELQQLLDNPQPNQARVNGVRGDVRRLEGLIAALRTQITEAQGENGSLARISAELRMAELDLLTRQTMAQQSLQSLEAARIEANRQVRYLSVSTRPIAPDAPTYPRKFENTLLSLLIFSGIYLMASLTAAVLREQVSS